MIDIESVLGANNSIFRVLVIAYFRSYFRVHIQTKNRVRDIDPVKHDAMLYCIELRRMVAGHSFIKNEKEHGVDEKILETFLNTPARGIAEILAERNFSEIQKQAAEFAKKYNFEKMPLTLDQLKARVYYDLENQDHRRIIQYFIDTLTRNKEPSMRNFKRWFGEYSGDYYMKGIRDHRGADAIKAKIDDLRRQMVYLGLKFNSKAGRPKGT